MGTTQRRTATTRIEFLGTGFVLALLLASSTRAQDAVTPSATPSAGARSKPAEHLHRAAVAAFAGGRFQLAIARWTEANQLRPSAAIAFNIARSYEKLDDEANALTWYRAYLAEAERPADQSRVARRIEELERNLSLGAPQQVTIRTVPSGASIRIDDGELRTTPWTASLAPGSHVVATHLAGYHALSQRFELPRERPIALELVLTRAGLQAPERQLAAKIVTVPKPSGLRPLATVAAPEPLTYRGRPLRHDDRAPHAAQGATLTLLGIIALASGAAALAGALAFETMRSRAEDDARAQRTQVGFAASLETMRSRQTLARIFGIGGAGLIATGGVMLLWPASDDERPPSTQVAVRCPLLTCGASVTGTF